MLFYRNVAVLSRDEHRGLKLKPVEGFAFAARTHCLPVAGAEFYQAARCYPILFASEIKNGEREIVPILLVGLDPGHNEYVNKALQWKVSAYLPAFVRRYPFVLAETPNKGSELTVCFDRDFEGFNEVEGQPLFNNDGSPSVLLSNAMQFMNWFNQEMARNRHFVEALVRLDLLDKRSAEIRSAAGDLFNLQDFLMVSEDKFAKLKASDLASLHEAGFLGWIFAHLMSLGNLTMLFDMRQARRAH
jgi:hypothetical protein